MADANGSAAVDIHPRLTCQATPFKGVWMGGFEGADHVNGAGVPLDMVASSGHADRLDEDHRRAARAGLSCIRESIGWRLAESRDGRFDLSRAAQIAASAERHGLQVMWTLMHYGVPNGVCLHDDALIERFVRFAVEVARVIGLRSVHAPIYTPVNEISYVAWAATQPNLLYPPNNSWDGSHANACAVGYAVKRRLARATLAAMAAMRSIDPRARFLHIDPIVHVAAPSDRPDLAPLADQFSQWQWQAWDLIGGHAEPELGGHSGALDLIGVNHYHSSQWEVGNDARLDWFGRDPRRRPLSELMLNVWRRYRKPIVLTETSHVGAGRCAWLDETAAEVRIARNVGVPVWGMCLYPLVDRPDWDRPEQWHRSGLFHVSTAVGDGQGAPVLARVIEPLYSQTLQRWQCELPQRTSPRSGAPVLLVFSHLRWDFVRHRSRHLMERLARHHRIVFVEEPLWSDAAPRLDTIACGPHIEVLVTHMAFDVPGFDAAQQLVMRGLLRQWLTRRGIEHPVAWLCTPMALRLAASLTPRWTVYDCADELSGFAGAPATLPEREVALLKCAHLVVTAGVSLAAARNVVGSRLRCVPNGVDAAYFASQRRVTTGWDAEEVAATQAVIPTPRLGFAGVIDERFDLVLLATLADARPHWQFVIIGPVVKIDVATLPRRFNVHWLGVQPYRLLPQWLAGWKVGLLPFLLHAATLRANPIKILEYLAAGLPVVATAVPDTALYRPAGVCVAQDARAFLAGCDAAIAENRFKSTSRRRAARSIVRRSSWDAAAATLHAQLLQMCATQANSVGILECVLPD